ncbi:MAG: sigma-70 family RNA polymerase sigma factor [Kineosporiaceae bacterium]
MPQTTQDQPPSGAPHTPLPRNPVGEELVARAASLPADHPGHADALETAVAHWTPMALRLARPFRRRTHEPEDLRQVAMTALVQTILRYDPVRGDFPPYAVPTITGEIRRWLRDCRDLVRVPRRLRELDVQVLDHAERLEKALGRPPTVAEVADRVGAPADEVADAARARAARRPGPLDSEAPTQQRAVAYTDDGFDVVERRSTVAPLIADLDDRSRRVLVLRYFHDMTQTEIAAQVGVSQVQVSRILARTLDRLRARAA